MRNVRVLFVLVLGMALLLGAAGPAAAATIFYDNFDSENGGNGQLNFYGFTQWTVSDGSVDLIPVGSSWDLQPGYGLYVDLDGSTGNAGTMTSIALNLAPGTYSLSFLLAGNQRNSGSDTVQVTMALGSLYSETFTFNGAQPFTLIERTITVDSAANGVALVFNHAGGDNVGLLLDEVKLETTAVPLPGAVWLLGSGLAGLVGLRRKIG